MAKFAPERSEAIARGSGSWKPLDLYIINDWCQWPHCYKLVFNPILHGLFDLRILQGRRESKILLIYSFKTKSHSKPCKSPNLACGFSVYQNFLQNLVWN